MTCRSKLAKIISIGNPKWPPKYIFRFFSETERPIDLKLGRKHRRDLQIKKKLKLFRSEIQDYCRCGRLENLFFASTPEPKGKLT